MIQGKKLSWPSKDDQFPHFERFTCRSFPLVECTQQRRPPLRHVCLLSPTDCSGSKLAEPSARSGLLFCSASTRARSSDLGSSASINTLQQQPSGSISKIESTNLEIDPLDRLGAADLRIINSLPAWSHQKNLRERPCFHCIDPRTVKLHTSATSSTVNSLTQICNLRKPNNSFSRHYITFIIS